jgi:hypothetical protein
MLALLNIYLRSLDQDGMDNSKGLGPCPRNLIPHQKDLDELILNARSPSPFL